MHRPRTRALLAVLDLSGRAENDTVARGHNFDGPATSAAGIAPKSAGIETGTTHGGCDSLACERCQETAWPAGSWR